MPSGQRQGAQPIYSARTSNKEQTFPMQRRSTAARVEQGDLFKFYGRQQVNVSNLNPSSFPIQNVKLRVKRTLKAALKTLLLLDLLASTLER